MKTMKNLELKVTLLFEDVPEDWNKKLIEDHLEDILRTGSDERLSILDLKLRRLNKKEYRHMFNPLLPKDLL